MTFFQSLSHYASFALNLYVVYFSVSALAFAAYVWKNVYREQTAELQTVTVRRHG